MSRPKISPVDRALDAYVVLTTQEKAVFDAVVQRLNPAAPAPAPRRRQKKAAAGDTGMSWNAAEAAKEE